MGIVLAVMILIKVSPILFLVYFIMLKNWRAASVCLISIVVLILSTLPVSGMDNWVIYFSDILPRIENSHSLFGLEFENTFAFADYSIVRFLNMFAFLLNIDSLVITIFSRVLCLFLCIYTFHRIKISVKSQYNAFVHYQMLICLMLFISPISWHTHFLFLAPAFMLFIVDGVISFQGNKSLMLLLASFVMIAFPDVVTHLPFLNHGILMFLKPVKLFGLIVLYIFLAKNLNLPKRNSVKNRSGAMYISTNESTVT